ncbi:MAG: acylhydrolase [Lachnospiraceae bacterium]
MKRLGKYPFFLLIVISSLCYGGYQLTEKAQDKNVKLELETILEQTVLSLKKNETGEIGETGEIREDKKEDAATEEVVQEVPVVETAAPQPRSFQRVEMNYLEDALFIGDSRTSILYEYAGWEQTDFFVKNGQMIWDIWDNTMNGVTLEEMLTQKKYGKIYIMLGINELGVGTADEFGEQFKTVVARVRELQPETIIFVEAIMHVTAGKDEENTYINNAEVNARNERLAQIPDNIMSFYIDVNEVLDDPATGKLNGAYSFDGVHIQAKYIDIWREFLLNHGIL